MVTSRIRFTARRRRSFGNAGGTGKVLRLSLERWKGGTRLALSGSWYFMEGSRRRCAEERWQH